MLNKNIESSSLYAFKALYEGIISSIELLSFSSHIFNLTC